MGHIELEELHWEDVEAAQAVLEACEDLLVVRTGRPVSADAAHALFASAPAGVNRADKHLLGISAPASRELLGIIDAIAGYPQHGVVSVGLFLVVPGPRQRTAGDEARACLEVWATRRGATTVRVTVHDVSFASLRTWQQASYEALDGPLREGRRLAVVFEKQLPEPKVPPGPVAYDCLSRLQLHQRV